MRPEFHFQTTAVVSRMTTFQTKLSTFQTALFSLGLSHWKRFWLVCTARSAI